MSGTNEYKLKLGETSKVRPGFFQGTISIVYAGMLNESIFSVVIRWSSGNNSLAYNLYISNHQKEFFTPKGRIQVEYVSPEEFRFSYFDI